MRARNTIREDFLIAVTEFRHCRISGMYTYRPDVLAQLWRHGVQPTPNTNPEKVREYVRDLYRYEIRRLRERYMRHEFPKAEYSARVDQLRRQYPVLALRAWEWVIR